MEKNLGELGRYIDAHREEMLHLWERLVNTESGPAQREGVAAVIALLREEMEQAGIASRVIQAGGEVGDILVGEWNGEAPKAPILFIGHTDTVFPPGEAERNPFHISGEGLAYGPGVLDMKGGLVIALYAVKALAYAGFRDRPIKFVLAGDEETMHKSSNAKALMVEEMKGAAAAFNFETGYIDDRLVVGRKGGGIVQIKVEGVAAHSGLEPEKGRSAILEAARIVMELEGENDIPRGKLINCGLISGGIGENTIPDECSLSIGYRFSSHEIEGEIQAAIDRAVGISCVAGTKITKEQKMHIACMETTAGVLSLFEHVKRAAKLCDGGVVSGAAVSGGSDSSIAVALGIPTVCGMGVCGQFNHTEKEYAQVDSLFRRCRLAAWAVATLDW